MIKAEVKEMIERNSGRVDSTLQTVSEMIGIYSILKKRANIKPELNAFYGYMAKDLQLLKSELQIQKSEYKLKKASEP